MAQLKSGSTVGGQTIATTAQAGAPTTLQAIGANQVGWWYQGSAYNIGYQRSGSQIRNSSSTASLTNQAGWGPVTQFQTGTWRSLQFNANSQTVFDENSQWVNLPSLWVRVS